MSENINHLLQPDESIADEAPPVTGNEEWAHGYGVREIVNSANLEGNSVVLAIEPNGGSTEAVLIAKDISLTIRPLEGKGRLVVWNTERPDEEVRVVGLDPSEPYKLVRGDAYYYLNTGDKTLLIRDDCVPAFQGDEEVLLTADPQEGQTDGRAIELPNSFWLNFRPVQSPESEVIRSDILNFFTHLKTKIPGVPELDLAVDYAVNHPDRITNIFEQYASIVRVLSRLSDNQLEQISGAKGKLAEKHGDTKSVPHLDATDILRTLKPEGRKILSNTASETVDPSAPYFNEAVSDLIQRMEGGHRLKLEDKKPVDGDPKSDKVIWGHTQVTGPEVLIHFTISHYLERYFSRVLSAQGVLASSKKDFFVNAMSDVLLLDHFGPRQFTSVFDEWQKPRNKGGLGWLSEESISAFGETIHQ